MVGILGLPAAFIAFVKRSGLRFLAAAVHAEFALVHGTAGGAGPADGSGGFRLATFHTEFAGISFISTFAVPGVCRFRFFFRFPAAGAEFAGISGLSAGASPAGRCSLGSRSLWLLGLLHLGLLSRHSLLLGCHLAVHAHAGAVCHIHAHESHSRAHAAFVCCSQLHSVCRRIGHDAHGDIRIRHGKTHLYFLQLRFVIFIGLDAVYAEGNDFDAAELSPFLGKDFIQRVRQLHGMSRELGVVDLKRRKLCKGRLQRRAKLGTKHAVQVASVIAVFRIACHIGVEKQRIHDVIAVFTEATDAHGEHLAGHIVKRFEGDFAGRAVLISQNFLHIEIVHSLVFAGVAAKGEAFAHFLKHILHAGFEVAGENGGLGGFVVNEFAGLITELYHLALFDDHHALAHIDRDAGPIGNDIVLGTGIGAAALGAGALLAFHHQCIRIERVTVYKFFPLVGQYPADRSNSCFDQTHM